MITVAQAVDEFLLACRADGLSPATTRWYESRLRQAATQIGSQPLNSITATIMREYVVQLRSRSERYSNAPQRPTQDGGLSPDTLHGHLRALRRFWNWCIDEYPLDPTHNPMKRIKLPRLTQQPKAIDLDDLRRLLTAAGNSVAGVRDRAILIFLADTGCRAAGALTLTPDRLQIEAGRAIVTEKGGKTRAVPFTNYTREVLCSWLRVRPAHAETIFCSLHPSRRGSPLTLSGLHSLIRRLKKQAGVQGRCNPHSLRHAYAREFLTNGGDLASLARLMGHSDISVTATYYAVFTEHELAEKHRRYSLIRSLKL